MTASAEFGGRGRSRRRPLAMVGAAMLPPGLRRLAWRKGERPPLDPRWPCLQRGQLASAEDRDALAEAMLGFVGVSAIAAPFGAPGIGFRLEERLAGGQPEAFIGDGAFMALLPGGSLHVSLRPEWAEKVVSHGWANVHPFARYMAGAVPPQSLMVFAPRDGSERAVVLRIAAAAHAYAMGRVGDVILPDTRW